MTGNNLIINTTDYKGNTIFMFSAKSRKYKSKQVRRTIVLEALWDVVIKKLKENNCKLLSLKFTGALEYKKKKMIRELLQQKIKLASVQLITPLAFNGCRIRHYRRV